MSVLRETVESVRSVLPSLVDLDLPLGGGSGALPGATDQEGAP